MCVNGEFLILLIIIYLHCLDGFLFLLLSFFFFLSAEMLLMH